MKYTGFVLALILCTHFVCYGQNSKIELIKRFYLDLYNTDVKPIDLVNQYIEYADTSGLKSATQSVSSFRGNPDGKDGYFATLKKEILENKFYISNYSLFGDAEKAKFTLLNDSQRSNVYKLHRKNNLSVYILMNKNKIVSFFGYQKAGDSNHTFIVY